MIINAINVQVVFVTHPIGAVSLKIDPDNPLRFLLVARTTNQIGQPTLNVVHLFLVRDGAEAAELQAMFSRTTPSTTRVSGFSTEHDETAAVKWLELLLRRPVKGRLSSLLSSGGVLFALADVLVPDWRSSSVSVLIPSSESARKPFVHSSVTQPVTASPRTEARNILSSPLDAMTKVLSVLIKYHGFLDVNRASAVDVAQGNTRKLLPLLRAIARRATQQGFPPCPEFTGASAEPSSDAERSALQSRQEKARSLMSYAAAVRSRPSSLVVIISFVIFTG